MELQRHCFVVAADAMEMRWQEPRGKYDKIRAQNGCTFSKRQGAGRTELRLIPKGQMKKEVIVDRSATDVQLMALNTHSVE